ncbi:MAG: FAD-binding protein [Phycisphaerae bacterium]|nr:FAD-binding protein [Phycisphaerae bacterium]
MYDAAIIGAGPAGSTLARLIAGHYKILLVDKRQLTAAPESESSRKCCGGLLAPDAQGMLSKMGLGLPKSVLMDPQLFVVRAIDVRQKIERYYQRYYINMDRRKFDCWLLSMVPSSVDVRLDCRFKSYESENGNFKLTLIQNNKSYVENAGILIGADGASSMVRKCAVPDRPFPKAYLGLQQWVQADHQLPYFSTIFDSEITDYYCWTIPKEDELVIGAALHPGKDVTGKFELLKNKLRDCGFTFGKVVRTKAAFILRPHKTKQIFTGTKGIALIGEAAGWISPSSAEGLSYAFKSALALADVLHKTPEDFEKRYYRKTQGLRANILLKNIKSHFMYDPWLRTIVMRTGLNSMKVHKS